MNALGALLGFVLQLFLIVLIVRAVLDLTGVQLDLAFTVVFVATLILRSLVSSL